jgi:hypothetical protein
MRWSCGKYAAVTAALTFVAWGTTMTFGQAAAAGAGAFIDDTVYYDYVDETGQLAGGRLLLRVPRPDPSQVLPAAVETLRLTDGPVANRIDLVAVGDGYLAGELGIYAQHVNSSLSTMFAQEPFKTYANYFNLHRVDVISKESGVDHDPTYPLYRDTAMDMEFWCGGTERLLCVNVAKAYSYAYNAPDVNMVLAVANSTKYGGAGYSGSNLATVSGGNGSAPEIALHEFGHSLGKLADEYWYAGETYSGPEPSPRNVSILTAAQMQQTGTKWAPWLGENNAAYDGLVSTYEGAYYCQYGIYRPTNNSKMRSLGRPFNLPGVEGLVIEMYKVVRPIDDATPPGTLHGTEIVYVKPVEPIGHALDVQWLLNGQPIAGATQTTLDLNTLHLAPGQYTLTVRVIDNTWFVRDVTARNTWLTQTREWPVHVAALLGDLNCDGVVDFADINPFVLAVANPAGYQQAFPNCNILNGDINQDGRVNFGDINPFVALLAGP